MVYAYFIYRPAEQIYAILIDCLIYVLPEYINSNRNKATTKNDVEENFLFEI